MSALKCGVVIGHYNSTRVLELNIRVVRERCGPVPILISDDCSDGMGPNPAPFSEYANLMALCGKYTNVYVWPNVQRIGHAGGDMSAFWKGIIWAHNLGLDYFAKISQRFIVDIPNWLNDGCEKLHASGMVVAGKPCPQHWFPIRTESLLLKTSAWHRPDILAHLTPREIAIAFELVIWDDITQRFGGKMFPWDILSSDRHVPAHGILFRAANKPDEYKKLAEKYGMFLVLDCRESNKMPNYKLG